MHDQIKPGLQCLKHSALPTDKQRSIVAWRTLGHLMANLGLLLLKYILSQD